MRQSELQYILEKQAEEFNRNIKPLQSYQIFRGMVGKSNN